MDLTARRVAVAMYMTGALIVAVGMGLVFLPAGVIMAGLAIMALGLFGVDVDRVPRR